jgi:uncharacterized protein YkwD
MAKGVLAGLVLCLTGCGGGSDAATESAVVGSTSDFTVAAQSLYAVRPDAAICRAGTLSAAEKASALAAVNAIRAAHGLAAVSQDSAGENEVMQIALMSAVNGRLSHAPTSAWGCHTAAGVQGAGSSNLYLGGPSTVLPLVSSAAILADWLADVGSEATLGHRRWMLDPFLKQVAFGRVDVQAANGQRTTGAALKVIHGADGTGPVTPDHVAYPVGDYPIRYFQGNPILSFTVIADKTNRQGNGSSAVDFGSATVSVVVQGGATLAVSGLAINHEGYGVPNNLRFRVNGLQTGVAHDVTVANVRVNGVTRSYRYTFRLVN